MLCTSAAVRRNSVHGGKIGHIFLSPKLTFTNSRRKYWLNSSELSKPCCTLHLCRKLLLCLKVCAAECVGSIVKVQWGRVSHTSSASEVRITKFGYPERGQLTAHLLPNCQPIKHLHFKHISCLDQGPGCCP